MVVAKFATLAAGIPPPGITTDLTKLQLGRAATRRIGNASMIPCVQWRRKPWCCSTTSSSLHCSLDVSIHKKAGLSKCASSSESQWNTGHDHWPIVGALPPPFQTHFSEQLEISGLLERDAEACLPRTVREDRGKGAFFPSLSPTSYLSRRHPRISLSFALPNLLPRPLHSTAEYFCLGIATHLLATACFFEQTIPYGRA